MIKPFTLTLILSLFFSSLIQSQAAEPLPINGRFDKPAPTWKFVADGWVRTGFWGTQSAPNDIKRELDGKNPYVWVSSVAGLDKGTILASWSEPIQLNPVWKQIKVSVRSRLTDLQRGKNKWETARLQLSFKTEDGVALKSYPSIYLEPSADWLKTEGVLKIPLDAHTMTVEFGFWGAIGNLDLDDVELIPLP